MKNQVIVVLGSNIDAEKNINVALSLLEKYFKVNKISSVLKTKPIGITNQPDFLNAAVFMETSLEREALIQRLKALEDELGRDRTRPKFGPREIDLDILSWNGKIVDDDYYSRDFLQQLVAELNQ
ncbi:2-amino-4-hydroxy-6-hydroxymethyldihydropteridine diphosphokinase [Thermophagus xiamenensis]|jgi:2-amino-4-hydroxy-6-hydroxymethyldihydropteridine diphosphokinase|uniref:2-amino-4-hydroxy-6-hydroxymethyldihydropteridine pyrophosphokinase n=1 Tax=Thermophagus xiamenensis TaxID=385682 RepID=A0A1I2BG59_9BACT|nr:2-amino-4-hydroxy-6-hydroxymethyldihydropteridine diphosphokinase [Thermophagus xiamenensis]SFE55106.1 2-amino-4-hydroxy-6-hydroxymethyldihydropteridinediphosphokinase [Thermophagus xiamenensis]